MGGVRGFPGVGYDNAAKFAAEGLPEAMAKVLAPLGVKILMMEAGPFGADWAGRALKAPKEAIGAAGPMLGSVAQEAISPRPEAFFAELQAVARSPSPAIFPRKKRRRVGVPRASHLEGERGGGIAKA